jgi:hypothetical protein
VLYASQNSRHILNKSAGWDATHIYSQLRVSFILGILLEEPRALRSYALAAWQSGQRDLGAAIAKQAVELSGGPDAMCMYCKMMYWLRGPMSVLEEIRRAKLELFHNSNFSFAALALAVAADHKQSVTGILSRCNLLFEHERGPQAHLLLATGKQVFNAAPHMLEFANALAFCEQILRLERICRRRNLIMWQETEKSR